MYRLGLREHIVVRVVAVYVAVSFVLIEILFCAVWCGPPITMYWDVPAKEGMFFMKLFYEVGEILRGQ